MQNRVQQEINEKEEIIEACKLFDRDGNGTVSHVEMRHILVNIGVTDEEIDDVFR